jgi:hypothetical protein
LSGRRRKTVIRGGSVELERESDADGEILTGIHERRRIRERRIGQERNGRRRQCGIENLHVVDGAMQEILGVENATADSDRLRR